MYRVGIIGGMGPLATVNFYEKLVKSTPAKSDNEHIDLVILNHATLPDRTECIFNNENEKFLKKIKSDFDIMNEIGVEVIAIPCNTSHYYYNDYKNFTSIPIVNMVESSVLEIKKLGYKKICVFSTTGTSKTKIYEKYALENNISLVEIDETDKKYIMDTIYTIKETNDTKGEKLNEMIEKYCTDDVIGIVACTELSLVKINEKNKSKVIDAIDILVKETLKYI